MGGLVRGVKYIIPLFFGLAASSPVGTPRGAARNASETSPLFATTLVGLYVHERGSIVFPRETRGDDLLSDRDANIGEPTWRVLSAHFGLARQRRDAAARALVGRAFDAALRNVQIRAQ